MEPNFFEQLAEEEEVTEVEEEESPKVINDRTNLLYLGYIEQDFEAFGHTFTLKTLTTDEELNCLSLVRGLTGEALPMEYERAFKTAMLAASLIYVDGEAIYVPLGTESISEVLRRKLKTIRAYHWPINDKLFSFFLQLEERKREAFDSLESK